MSPADGTALPDGFELTPRDMLGANQPPEPITPEHVMASAQAIVAEAEAKPPTPYELARNAVDALFEEAEGWLDGEPVTTELMATGVGLLKSSLANSWKDAEAARKLETVPLDAAKKEVQDRFNPVLAKAKLAEKTCDQVLAPYLRKLKADQEEAAKLLRVEADAKTAAAAAALAAVDQTNLKARNEAELLVEDAKKAGATAKRAEGAKAHVQGGDRAVGLRTVWTAKLVNRRDAMVHYWATNPDAFEAILQQLADADKAAGKRQVPGFEITSEQVL